MLLPTSTITHSPEINIIAPFLSANDGDWQAIDLYEQYNKTLGVKLWSQNAPHNVFKNYPIREIKTYAGDSPHSGILIISGARTDIGLWYDYSQFEKVYLLHNLLSPRALYQALGHLSKRNLSIEVIYSSNLVKRFAGLPGKVVYHIPSPERFKPILKTSYQQSASFTVGRTSADVLAKHHHSDPALYKSLVSAGMQINITGGTCLAPWLQNEPNIHLSLPMTQDKLPERYNLLDCFYYRVPSTVKEAYGLVVIEAMLTGLPVVCHRDVGASELIQHGVNGFIFDHADEAINIINALKNNANLREEIGINASSIINY